MENISEFKKSDYREFYSMLEFVTAIRRTLKVATWGAHGWIKMNDQLLRFRVQARRHRGYIFVAVNGLDLFDVWLTGLKGNVKKEFNNLYAEDFISVIDTEIEFIPEYKR